MIEIDKEYIEYPALFSRKLPHSEGDASAHLRFRRPSEWGASIRRDREGVVPSVSSNLARHEIG